MQYIAPRDRDFYHPSDLIEALDDLICEIDGDAYDADGDSLTYTIDWEVDGVAYEDATSTHDTGDTYREKRPSPMYSGPVS